MRLRVRFSKLGKVRWTSHRDVARMWERAFRRVTLPLAYTQGFSPRPKVSFGLALPTGHESVAEYLDLELSRDSSDGVDLPTLAPQLTAALPTGVDVFAVAVVEDRADSLQQAVTACEWQVEVVDTPDDELQELAASALAGDSLLVSRERKGHLTDDDIRPALRRLVV